MTTDEKIVMCTILFIIWSGLAGFLVRVRRFGLAAAMSMMALESAMRSCTWIIVKVLESGR